jgi:hypothetical protein
VSAGQAVDLEGVLVLPEGGCRISLKSYSETKPNEPNLSCYDRVGEKLWDAEEAQTSDKWVAVRLEGNRIVANSFGGFLCELDRANGKIVSSKFVK